MKRNELHLIFPKLWWYVNGSQMPLTSPQPILQSKLNAPHITPTYSSK